MCTRYPIINRVSELKVHIELTRFVQPEKIEIDANERAVNEKSQYCFFVCTTFDSFLNDFSIRIILVCRFPFCNRRTGHIHFFCKHFLCKPICTSQLFYSFSHCHIMHLLPQNLFYHVFFCSSVTCIVSVFTR